MGYFLLHNALQTFAQGGWWAPWDQACPQDDAPPVSLSDRRTTLAETPRELGTFLLVLHHGAGWGREANRPL